MSNNFVMPQKNVLGLIEPVIVIGQNKSLTLKARIDTGAQRCSIDVNAARKLGYNIVSEKLIRSAHGKERRAVAYFRIMIMGKLFKASFTIANRLHMKYKLLIGRNLLKYSNFIIDPNK